MCKFLESKLTLALVLVMFTLAAAWNTYNGTGTSMFGLSSMAPDAAQRASVLTPSAPQQELQLALGTTMPPAPWEEMHLALGTTMPPAPWEEMHLALGTTMPPAPWEELNLAA
ncbi:MAG TPA: hypothetical protein VG675_03355 [Bryobacteraceae bacterium]|nr:hypothetical protein [Bryobacteraceae bacterium]